MTAVRKMRADELVVQQGLCESRSKAKALIVAGEVRSGDRVIEKPSELLDPALPLELRDKLPYVSRGGVKLAHALDAFDLDVEHAVCADIGASTGGFTDVLLKRGAARVYAIDVGYGQLDYRLRSDPRVVVMERTNARHLDGLPEPIDVACVDVSFISLEHILPVVARLLRPGGGAVTLVKPQFEAGKEQIGKGGVVRDDRVRRRVVERVTAIAATLGLNCVGVDRSPITGPAGNVEFLAVFRMGGDAIAIDAALDRLFETSVRE